eukprot:GDKI01020030.1.p1 GENE.GDKI01020030.1~~GDKI01020030.1.p1  ORF type:complete len:294 (-),score=75.59 GDKI01020030.1:104-985(-)
MSFQLQQGPPFVAANGNAFTQLFQIKPALEVFYFDFEKHWDSTILREWMENNWAFPIVGVLLYILLITAGPRVMKERQPFDLKYPLAVWNFGLSLFSFFCVFRTVPHLFFVVLPNYTLKETLCLHPSITYSEGACGFWVQMFILSKLPELIDTLFIVVRKKPLLFLHWYHHITVLLYSWHVSKSFTGGALYFVAMNSTVHAVMYAYYGMQALKAVPRSFPAWTITLMQIGQMVVGTFVCVASMVYKYSDASCSNTTENLVAGGLMYFSYLYLFVEFAVNRFIRKKTGKVAKGE